MMGRNESPRNDSRRQLVMAASGAGRPDLLAIGVSRGGPSPANELVNEALMGYLRMVMREQAVFPNEGLRINIVFHVPGPIFQPDYKGVHATKLDRKNSRVLVAAAVPSTLQFDEVSGYFADVLRQARQKASTTPASESSRPPLIGSA